MDGIEATRQLTAVPQPPRGAGEIAARLCLAEQTVKVARQLGAVQARAARPGASGDPGLRVGAGGSGGSAGK